MTKVANLSHKFVEHIPDELESGMIYVSISFATVVHKCCCGCGNEVVTPLTPTDWTLLFNGKTVSLDPSIGNWSFKCQSHYWIKDNKIKWSNNWSSSEVEAGRAHDRLAKQNYYARLNKDNHVSLDSVGEKSSVIRKLKSLWQKFITRFR